MGVFEEWCKGITDPEPENNKPHVFSEMIHQREWHFFQVSTPDEVRERWEEMNYIPKPIQLKLL